MIKSRRIKLYKGRLDCQSIMIASKYFDSIEDYRNLEMCSIRFHFNTEKFFYNPISLNSNTIKLFPNIQTLHLYEEKIFFSDIYDIRITDYEK